MSQRYYFTLREAQTPAGKVLGIDHSPRDLIFSQPLPIIMANQAEDKPIPIFMKLDGNSTFKQIKSEDISRIIQDLEQMHGLFNKGGVTIASGGHSFIRPISTAQPKELLSTTKVLNGSLYCSLPNSHNSQRMIIRQVPTDNTNEDTFIALEKQGYKIANVHRFSIIKGTKKTPSTTVALELKGTPPQEILLNSLFFISEKQLPSSLRCKHYQKLGHTERFCSSQQACPICSKSHEDLSNFPSSPHCANCNGNHLSSFSFRPAFLNMRSSSRVKRFEFEQV